MDGGFAKTRLPATSPGTALVDTGSIRITLMWGGALIVDPAKDLAAPSGEPRAATV
jgi:hypothetical protein